jgi:chromosome segregation ATPase
MGTTSIFPFDKTSDTFQIIVREEGTRRRFGSVTMKLDEIYKLKLSSFKHWISLFENTEDDVYNGNYNEDDTELPRVLLSYEIIKIVTEDCLNPDSAISTPEDIEELKEMHTEIKTETRIRQEKVVTRYSVIKNNQTVTQSTTNFRITEEYKNGDKMNSKVYENNSKELFKRIGDGKETNTKGRGVELIEDTENNDRKGIDEEMEELRRRIKVLMEENERLRSQLKEAQLESETNKKEAINKYYSEIREYKEHITTITTEKYNLQQEVSSLQKLLETSDKELKNAVRELKNIREQAKAETKAMEVKITRYETIIEEYKRTIETKKVEGMDLNEYIRRLQELERKYVQQLNEVKVRFEESESKRLELNEELYEKNENERKLRDKVQKLEEENMNLSKARSKLQDELNSTYEKLGKIGRAHV